ncbi:MAG: FAD-binding protein [Bifidobacteriaceae bacterium]|jgi:glycolate oxidase|nr:FAD-binding protein [Bifidobacteriaceae bacterium]
MSQTTVPPARSAQLSDAYWADWEAWRRERDQAAGTLASNLGTHPLDATPRPLPGLPGSWSAVDGVIRSNDAVHPSPVEIPPGSRVQLDDLELAHVQRPGQVFLRVFGPPPATPPVIETFDPDPSWAVPATFTPAVGGEVQIDHVDGWSGAEPLKGRLSFKIDGQPQSLTLTGDGPDLQAVFADASNGAETQQFRFVSIAQPDAAGHTTLDFNRARLPPCAFSDHYLCPLPPPGNRLGVKILAGEARVFGRQGPPDGARAGDRTASSTGTPPATTDPAELERLATDRSGWRLDGLPALVAKPTTVSQVQAFLKAATRHNLPVVPRGAGTGLAGGAAAGAGSWVLDLTALNRIIELDPANGLARVEPGVITADLDNAARAHGLFFPPDPGSAAISTIGGNIATNAGGLRGAKYGVTGDWVLALEVALADGSLVSLRRPTIKSVSGLDLVSLIVGSEGTLGVVVGATLRLAPVPPATATAAAYFASARRAGEAVTAVAQSGAGPAVLEILDGATLQAVDALRGTSLRGRGEALVLLQTDGFGAEAELEVALAALAPLADAVIPASSPAEAETLLAARRDALPAVEALGTVIIEDIAVPRARLAEALEAIDDIRGATGAEVFVFGHAGEGNLHPLILDREAASPAEAGPAAQAATEQIFDLALRLGGTLTAEHGIGLAKLPWLEREVGRRARELASGLKRVLDPLGVLNPGKAI